MTRKTKWRGVAGVLFAVFGILISTSLPAKADTGAGGFPIIGADDGYMVHKCEVIGSADGYQAVVCVNILTGASDADQTYWFEGTMQAYCQTDAGVKVQCANIVAEGVFANGDGWQDDIGSRACGHTYGACPAGGETLVEGTYTSDYGDYPNCFLYDANDDAWMVAYGGNTQIELPVSDDTIELGYPNGGNDGANYSSGHYLVCPYNPQ